MWLWILLFLAFLLYSVKEPYTGSPNDFVQEQSGEIDDLHNKLQKIRITESYIDALQTDSNRTSDQINQLNNNVRS